MTSILGIETSCDETAAAVVTDRIHVRSSIVASQIDLHRAFGGVVPEIAARRHVETIGTVITEALEVARAGWDDLDAVAVTRGPGLIGSLLVGLSVGKALAWQRGLPLLAIHHLEGHIRSAFLEHAAAIRFPAVALVVSGGHTSLFSCAQEDSYRLLARTRDDAAGEAFDKVAKLLGLGYPGGPVIDRLSDDADERAFDFPRAQMKDQSMDFSFSGIKTAVRLEAERQGLIRSADREDQPQLLRDLVASFQKAVVDVLIQRTLRACRETAVETVLVTGGVACNRRLRRAFGEAGAREGLLVCFPSPALTTDNAAMIAAAGFLHLERGRVAGWDVSAEAGLRLGSP